MTYLKKILIGLLCGVSLAACDNKPAAKTEPLSQASSSQELLPVFSQGTNGGPTSLDPERNRQSRDRRL